MNAWVERHQLSAYFVLAYTASWSVAVPLALQAQGVLGTHMPPALHYLTASGPAIAALIAAWLLREPEGSHRPVQWYSVRHSTVWWLVGFGSPLLLFAVARLVARTAGQTVPAWLSLGRVSFLPDLGLGAWFLWFATSGCGEELGWRGFALPRLQQTHSALTSSVLLAFSWAGWHVPAFFYVPGYAALGLRVLPGFFLSILAGSIVLTWLYNSSGQSVLAAMLWHASFNFVTASPNAGGLVAAVTSSLVMVWAIVVLWRNEWATLAHRSMPAPSVRANRDEKTRTLPGDELISQPIASLTYAVTIQRPPHNVWPWLVQMGAGNRAGWYSYDFIDNGRRPSADRIVPALQTVAVGDLFPATPGATDGFHVLARETARHLVLGWRPAPGATPIMTWAFILEWRTDTTTRLIVRARGGREYPFYGLPPWLGKPLIRFGHYVMQRKQLLGIAARAESREPSRTVARTEAA